MKLNKKLILLSILTTFIVVFLFAVYGEKPAIKFDKLVKIEQNGSPNSEKTIKNYQTDMINGTRFEDDFLSIVLPIGWSAGSEDESVVLTKNSNQFMKITIFEMLADSATVGQYLQSKTATQDDVSVEDIVIGVNSFTKATSSMGVSDSATLYCVTPKGLLTIVAGMFNEPEVLVILGSLILK